MKKYIFLSIKALFLIGVLTITLIVFWGYKLNHKINTLTKNGWFPPSTQVFALGETIHKGAFLNYKELSEILINSNFKYRDSIKHKASFKKLNTNECIFNIGPTIQDTPIIDTELINNCLLLNTENNQKVIIGLSLTGHILFITENNLFTDHITLPSYSIAQYHDGKPFLRENIEIGDTPLYCLQAITAVEDKNFLQHRGISIKGILRALLRNLKLRRKAEGASTITQQLVKNYFLTHERTYKRKAKEIIMAILIELKFSKDQILSNYLNVIYLGQSSNFQIIGYSAASKHYFQKNISNLNLQECALLAAIVNNPGLFNPFTKPENALNRRNKVLTHMLENEFISKDEFTLADKKPLPKRSAFTSTKSSAYFLDAIKREIEQLNLDSSNGLNIFTSISPLRQIHAQKVITSNLKKIEENNSYIKKNNIKLQASLINVDIKTGYIKALIGGRTFNQTQFNRPLSAKRQVGSIMKPFVYITALEGKNEYGEQYNALSLLIDEMTTYKYSGQTWTPKNYSRTYQDQVPLFYALKNSLNAPTAALGMQLGVESVIETAKRLGIKTELPPYPSLFLGAIELSQMELLQAYSTIANNGQKIKNSFVQKVTDHSNNVLFEIKEIDNKQLIRPDISSQIISILEQTTITGTARSIKTWRKFSHPIAGKTGTTNNTKDAWFVGFSPDSLTLVWVGHDKNLKTNLTGASGALPIWSDYMKKVLMLFPVENNFAVSPGTVKKIIPQDYIQSLIPTAKDHELIDTTITVPQNYETNF